MRSLPQNLLLTTMALLLVSSTATAQDTVAPKWDAFPEMDTYKRVGIKERYDGPAYKDLRQCIRRLKSKVGARYYVGLVDITDAQGRKGRKHDDAQPYAKALFEAWQTPAKLKTETSIVIAMGIQNRSVGVHPGTKWQKLGLDDQAIADTIAGSDWQYWLKRYDRNQALCSVATSIDFKLVNLERAMERRIEAAKKELPAVEKRLAELQTELKDGFGEGHVFGDSIKARADKAAKDVESAKSTIESDPVGAVRLLDEARKVMDSIAADRKEYDASMAGLKTYEDEVTALKTTVEARPDSSWAHPVEALTILKRCSELAAKIRSSNEGDASDVRDCRREAEIALARGDVHHHYKASVIPTMIATAVATLVALILVAVFLRRRRIVRLVDRDLAEWNQRLDDALLQLGKMQEEFASYLKPRALWQGEAAELDLKTIERLNQAFLLSSAGQAILAKARKHRASAGGWNIFALQKAAVVLRETPVDILPADRDPRCPVEFEGASGYSGQASELVAELTRSVWESRAKLTKIEDYVHALDQHLSEAKAASATATQAVAERERLKLSVTELRNALEGANAGLHEGSRLAGVDPILADALLEKAAIELSELNTRVRTGNSIVERVRGPVRELGGALRQDLRQLLNEYGSVQESGFDPEAVLNSQSEAVDAILGLVTAGKAADAQERLDQVELELEELRVRLAVRAEAPALVALMADEIGRRNEEMRGDILKIRMSIQKADASIQESYEPYLAKLSEFQSNMGRLTRIATQIKDMAKSGRYLAAIAELRRNIQPFEDGIALVAQLVTSTGIQAQARDLKLPDTWVSSASARWQPGDFGTRRSKGTRRF